MNAKFLKYLILVPALTLVAACSETGGYKEPAGALLGGAGGALAGSQFGSGSGRLAATAAGALLGAFAGQQAGQSLDRADYVYRQQRAYYPPQQVPMAMPYYGAPVYFGPPASYRPHATTASVPPIGATCQALPTSDPWAVQSYACPGPGGWYITQ